MGNKTASSVFEEALFKQRQQENQHRFTLELGLFLAIVFGSFMVGVNNLTYNTLFLDEAINAILGEDLLQGVFTRNGLSFHFGSYLYPALAALLNEAGGVTAMRLGSTFLICLASVFIYFTAKHLFGYKAALFALLLFCFSGTILNLQQMAVYDALALPLLAGAFLFLVVGAKSAYRQTTWLLAASFCTVFSILSKYIGLIYLPALFLTALAFMRLRGTSLRQALTALARYFLLPILLVLGLYAALYWSDLTQVFERQGFAAASGGQILVVIGREIGVILLLALAGLIFLAYTALHRRADKLSFSSWIRPPAIRWESLPRFSIFLYIALILFLLCTWLAAPFEQLLTGNIRSLWKNCAYSLIFLAPLAGYSLAVFLESVHTAGRVKSLIGLACLCLGTVYFANQALNSNWIFHQSWPNTEGVINYLREAGLDQNSRVLAEDMDIYEYYFDFGTNDRQVWNNFWYMEYAGKTGQEGAIAAIRDRVPDFVILDDYYLPGLRKSIEPVLSEAGYVVGWQAAQRLRAGDTILVQVFIPAKRGAE